MRRAMLSALWRFSTTRMLHEYTELLYLPPAAGSAPNVVPDAGSEEPSLVTERG
jgi:hypothetical protein